ncbi:MAG: non-canonical purine NTP pyrophosphatase [Candidatus Bruticola sp.]
MLNPTKPKLLLATGNAHKAAEIRAILQGMPIELVSLNEIEQGLSLAEPAETGTCYLDNALIKARHYGQAADMACIADDSGLEIEALNGAPGLFSHRFLNGCANQAEKNKRVLEILGSRPKEERLARFRCLCVISGLPKLGLTEPEYISSEAVCPGSIAFEAYGQGGFGYDPIFIPDNASGRHMAELKESEKNAISHRGLAVRQAVQKLLSMLSAQK